MELSHSIYGTINHQQLVPVSSGVAYSCTVCGKMFMHRRTLKRHEQAHATANNFTCLECGKNYSQAYDLERHLRSHRGDKPYRCQVCMRPFSMAHHLTNHMVTHTGVRAYSCLVCAKRFAQTFSLKRHMRMHLRLADVASISSSSSSAGRCTTAAIESNPAPSAFVADGMALLRSLSCNRCRKVFSSQQTLKRHRCPFDDAAVETASASCHLLDLHGAGRRGASSHRCTECGADFSTSRLLNEHVTGVHRGGQPPDKPHECVDCGKRFAHPYSLKRHRVEHGVGGDAHICTVCQKRFAQAYELDRHLKSHRGSATTGERMLNCAVCARSFAVPQYVADRLAQLGIDKAPSCENCLRCGFVVPPFMLKATADCKVMFPSTTSDVTSGSATAAVE